MKLVLLDRLDTSDLGTFGRLLLPGGRTFSSLECPWRNNEPGVSCVLPRTYVCRRWASPTFGMVYQLQDVLNRTHVLMHSGNHAGDRSKGLKCDVRGCILVGLGIGPVLGQKGVTSSASALALFETLLSREPFELRISWASGLP